MKIDSNASILTPQERWQEFRQQHLPNLSRRQRWTLFGLSTLFIFLFILLILPFLLPFAGPKSVDPTTLIDPNGAFLTLSGKSVYFVHYPADGDAVILIHGLGGATISWQNTAPALQASGFDVYALDLIGAGLSEKGLDLDYSHPAQVEMIVEFMDAKNITEAHLVSHAFGGNIALMMVQEYPERVKHIAMVAPTVFPEPTPQVSPLVLNLPFVERWARVLMHFIVHEAVGEQLRSATKNDEVVTDQLIEDYGRVLYTPDWDLAAIGMLRDSHLNTLPAPLESIEQPVLLMWGTEDGWAPPDNANGLLEKIPNSSLIEFEGIGHLPMHEVPEAFNTALINFLDN